MTTAAAQISTGIYGLAMFVEMQFSSGTVRVSTLPQNITWNGYTWTGLGVLGNVDAIRTTTNADPISVGLTLTVADSTYFSLANGNVSSYRNKPVSIYLAVLDETCTTVCTDPRLAWQGIMNVVTTSIGEDGKGAVKMSCEPASVGMNKKNSARLSHQQQVKEYPGDLGYQYIPDLIGKPTPWLTKRFQQT